MTPDWMLLRRYAQDNSQEAFAALTARYLNLVYAVCLREVHDPELAQDVTQAVFLLLARTAPRIRSRTALPSWLFRTARFASQNARTRERRRLHYEEKAALDRHPHAAAQSADWDDIEPLLNCSLAALRQGDRDSILLRFFQGLSFAEVGASLGVSEEAARKRVTRSLDKMKHFFGKAEVPLSGVVLASLLTTQAAKTAPAACHHGVTQFIASSAAGHASAALTGSHAYQLVEGITKAMKIAKMKMLTGGDAVVLVGGAVSYGMLHGQAPDQKTAYRTVILTGKARYADGKPAGGVRISAQVQDASEMSLLRADKPGPASERMREIDENMTWTKPDGTYALAVGADLRYNVMLLPNNLLREGEDDGWVAAAAEGVSGHKNQKVSVPDLILTRGAFVTGTVTDKATGRPLSGVSVGSYGPERPSTSTAVVVTRTDSNGHYRLRVSPGKSQVYIADGRYEGQGLKDGTFLSVAAGQTKVISFHAVPKQ